MMLIKFFAFAFILLNFSYGFESEVLRPKRLVSYASTIPCTYVDPSCTLSWYFDASNSKVFFKLTFRSTGLPTWYGIGFNTNSLMVLKNNSQNFKF